MAFTPWEQTRTRGNTPKVSIRSNGQIGFNVGAVKSYQLGDCPYIKLYYDEEQQIIGFAKTMEKETPGAMRLNVRENNAYVTAKGFLDNFQIDHTVTSTGLLEQEETEFGQLLTVSVSAMKKRKPRTKKEPLL